MKRGTRALAAACSNGQISEERLQREKIANRILVTACLKYLVLMLPGTGYVFLKKIFQQPIANLTQYYIPMRLQLLNMAIAEICLSFYYINSCFNFLIYMLSGSDFRNQITNIWRGIVGFCFKKEDSPGQPIAPENIDK